MTTKTKKEILAEFENHPALKFANDAIALQAVRAGTNGYDGEQNLTQWLEEALNSYADHIIEQVMPNKELLQELIDVAEKGGRLDDYLQGIGDGWSDCERFVRKNYKKLKG